MTELPARDAISVLGSVPVTALGIILPHERLLVCVPDFIELDEVTLKGRQDEPVTLENLGWVRQYWTYNKDNLRPTSEELAMVEIGRFASLGGSTVVDLTVPGIGRNPVALARIARVTGLNTKMACGAYVAESQPAWVRAATAGELAHALLAEARAGVGDSAIRSGIIKVGCQGRSRKPKRRPYARLRMRRSRRACPSACIPGATDRRRE
jgi:phosphotriesterase-related protein